MKPSIPILSREQITQMQMGIILGSISTLLPYFRLSDEWSDDDSGGALDGGTRAAVSSTLIGLCNRLDEIIDDKSRWSLEATNKLEIQLENLYKAHSEVLVAQQEQLAYMARPHVRHNPTLVRLLDGSWAAILGSLNDLENSIVGIGGSPAQELDALDEMFNGRIPSHLQAWIAVREEALKNNLQPPNYEKTKLDPGTSGNPAKPEGQRGKPPRNRRTPRKDKDGSGPKGGSPAEI